jgi:hypothetical protein
MISRKRKRPTLSESVWPIAVNFEQLSTRWKADATQRMLSWVWEGYDRLLRDSAGAFDSTRSYEDLERDLTQLLEPRIRAAMPDFLPFYLQHGPYERETRLPAPAQPPAYDLAFVMNSHPRVMWPLEAKVLKNDADVAAYVADIQEQFVKCRYAPFSSEAAMLGYLLAGVPENAARVIATKLGTELFRYEPLKDREHRCSLHTRRVPRGKKYSRRFTCHHLLMLLTPRNMPRRPR